MADPVSLAASILTIISAINVAHQGIQRVLALKKAPKRLIEAHNKVSGFSISREHEMKLIGDARLKSSRFC